MTSPNEFTMAAFNGMSSYDELISSISSRRELLNMFNSTQTQTPQWFIERRRLGFQTEHVQQHLSNYVLHVFEKEEGTTNTSAPGTESCPICSSVTEEVRTNCGHGFCLSCIQTHYQEQSHNCPYCRQLVTHVTRI